MNCLKNRKPFQRNEVKLILLAPSAAIHLKVLYSISEIFTEQSRPSLGFTVELPV